MYTPTHFENQNIDQLQQIIEQFNFATLISHAANNFQVSHVPMLLDRTHGKYGTLRWHVAALNPHAKLDDRQKALCIFHGPHAYISSNWYQNIPACRRGIILLFMRVAFQSL